VIFTDRFRTILRRGSKNILSLLSCGALSSHEESRANVKSFADQYVPYSIIYRKIILWSSSFGSGLFDKILCFSQANFQPSATHGFISSLTLSHFIFDRPKLENILRDHQSLGAHTDVVQFKRGNVTTFRWTHPGARPMGFKINSQCPNCNRLKTREPKPSLNHSTAILQCLGCDFKQVYTLEALPKWLWVHGPPVKGDGRGAWVAFPETHMIEDNTVVVAESKLNDKT
jgi:hypothetical protein